VTWRLPVARNCAAKTPLAQAHYEGQRQQKGDAPAPHCAATFAAVIERIMMI
jgi:hypothetical protein